MSTVRHESPFHQDTLTDAEWASLDSWHQGYLQGLWAYAWWQDGTPMVGSTGSTFREAVDRVMREWGRR